MRQKDRDDYFAAYAAWRSATDAFEAKLRRAVNGEPCDISGLEIDAAALKRLHIVWMARALPLTTR